MPDSAAAEPRAATIATSERTTCAPPSATATASAVRSRRRARWVRWSRPPVRNDTPRRRRGVDHEGDVERRDADEQEPERERVPEAAAPDAPVMASTATASPSGMDPPSPRKIRAGCASRLCGRKPAHHAGERRARDRQPLVPGHDAEQRERCGGDHSHGRRLPVHVVEEVEGVDHADDPDGAERRVRAPRPARAPSRARPPTARRRAWPRARRAATKRPCAGRRASRPPTAPPPRRRAAACAPVRGQQQHRGHEPGDHRRTPR